MAEEPDERMSDAEFDTWHVHDAGGPVLCLKVRHRGAVEVPNWQDGPGLFEASRPASRKA